MGTSSSWKAPASASSARPVPDGLSVIPVYPKCLDASEDNEQGWVLLATRGIRSRRIRRRDWGFARSRGWPPGSARQRGQPVGGPTVRLLEADRGAGGWLE